MSQRYLGSEKQNLLNAIGTELAWGWSPAVDFTSVLPAEVFVSSETEGPRIQRKQQTASEWLSFLDDDGPAASPSPNSEEPGAVPEDVNLLLCGAGDIRHIFKTIAEHRCRFAGKACKKLHFYIYETNLRVHSRHLFFLQWLTDSVLSLSELEDRVSVFLEAYGNSMVREITAANITHTTAKAVKAMSSEDGNLAPMINFSDMKLKEKDFIEEQMRAWMSDTKAEAHIEGNWQARVRTEMAERYDNRDNIIDWDFNFGVMDHTNAMRYQEYRLWRNTGVAYDYCHINPRKGVNYDYTRPNKTLCHYGRSVKGVQHGTYHGDVKIGPFYAFGAVTANENLHKRNIEGQIKYGNGVIAMHNVRAMLYQLLCGQRWPWADHAIAWDDPNNYNYLPPGTQATQEYTASLPDVEFHFVGLDWDRFLFSCADKGRQFDAAFVGANSTQFMTHEFFGRMRAHGVVVAETIKAVLDASDDAKDAFVGKIRELCHGGGFGLDTRLTAGLHQGIPQLKQSEGQITEGQKRTAKRYVTPFELVYTKNK